MDDKLQSILETLPESSSRSCLDPFIEFINELRRRGRTYREMARILADHCDIRVSVSTIYRFLHSRTRTKPLLRSQHLARHPEVTKGSAAVQGKPTAKMESEKEGETSDKIQERIAALKNRQEPTETTPKLFDYDPDQPLHLRKKTDVSKKQRIVPA
jgi:IS30 family transposase